MLSGMRYARIKCGCTLQFDTVASNHFVEHRGMFHCTAFSYFLPSFVLQIKYEFDREKFAVNNPPASAIKFLMSCRSFPQNPVMETAFALHGNKPHQYCVSACQHKKEPRPLSETHVSTNKNHAPPPWSVPSRSGPRGARPRVGSGPRVGSRETHSPGVAT